MPEHPSLSVLVTVYNREVYLAECLESILASSFEDFEVVVVDDRSSDASVAIARSFADRDRRVRVFQNDENLGDYRNRTRAASLARGRFLKYVDSDDLIYAHTLAVMVDAMVANPDAALALTHSLAEAEKPYPLKLSPAEAWQQEFLGSGCLTCGPSGSLIRRDAFVEVGGFREWGVLSDIDLWYRLSASRPVVLLAPGLIWWRRHDDQQFALKGADLFYLEKGFELVKATLATADPPISEGDRAAALSRANQHHARRLLSLAIRRHRPLHALRLFRRSGLSGSDLIRGLTPYQ